MQRHGTRIGTVTICMLAILLVVCALCMQSSVAVHELSAAEYDVLSAWITGTFQGQESRGGGSKDIVKIVMYNESYKPDLRLDGNGQPILWKQTSHSLVTQSPSLQQTTIDAFQKINSQQACIRRSFHIQVNYELIDSTRLDNIFKNNGRGWMTYYKQFPNSQGILTFSRVSFSADGTQALFYLSNRCGGLCGCGRYVVMEKRNGHWMIGKEIEMWVS